MTDASTYIVTSFKSSSAVDTDTYRHSKPPPTLAEDESSNMSTKSRPLISTKPVLHTTNVTGTLIKTSIPTGPEPVPPEAVAIPEPVKQHHEAATMDSKDPHYSTTHTRRIVVDDEDDYATVGGDSTDGMAVDVSAVVVRAPQPSPNPQRQEKIASVVGYATIPDMKERTQLQTTAEVLHDGMNDDEIQFGYASIPDTRRAGSSTSEAHPTENNAGYTEVGRRQKSSIKSKNQTESTQHVVDDQVIYAEVKKDRQSIVVDTDNIVVSAADKNEDEDAPPVPEKTDDAFIEHQDDEDGTNVFDRIHAEASRVREQEDYETVVMQPSGHILVGQQASNDQDPKDDGHVPNVFDKIHEKANQIKEDQDDYETVTFDEAGNIVLSSDGSVHAMREKADEVRAKKGYYQDIPENSQPKLLPIFDDGVYDEVQLPGPSGNDSASDATSGSIGEASSVPVPESEPPYSDTTLPKGYMLDKHLNVFFHVTDITTLHVDVIVNPANEHLKHSHGLAATIVKAAGKDMEKEDKKLMKKHHSFKVSDVVFTKAGKLSCQRVLHAVGPKWQEFQHAPDKCGRSLEAAYESIISACVESGVKTVALPLLSCGRFKVPEQIAVPALVQSLFKTTNKFKKQGRTLNLALHVVDIKPDLLQQVVMNMNKNLTPITPLQLLSEQEVNMFIANARRGEKKMKHSMKLQPKKSTGNQTQTLTLSSENVSTHF